MSKQQRNVRRKQTSALGSQPRVAALKFNDACRYLGGIHPATLRRMMERGLVRSNRTLRVHLFPISELDRVLEEGMTE